MHDLQLVLQKLQPLDRGLCDPGELVLRNPIDVEGVETPGVHVLDTVVYAGFDQESAVEFDNLGRDGSMENIELHDDPVQFRLIQFESDFL